MSTPDMRHITIEDENEDKYVSPVLIDDLLVATEIHSHLCGEDWQVEYVGQNDHADVDDITAWRLTRSAEQVVRGCIRDLAYWWNGYMDGLGVRPQ